MSPLRFPCAGASNDRRNLGGRHYYLKDLMP
jgi:hypothetical protein